MRPHALSFRALVSHAVATVAALAVVSLAAGPSRAAVLFSTLDAGGGFDHSTSDYAAVASQGEIFAYSIRTATRFSVIGGPYLLDSVTLPIGSNGSNPSIQLCVQLRKDQGGYPGDVLETLSVDFTWPVLGPTVGAMKLVSSSHPRLPEAYYWIEACLMRFPNMNEGASYYWYRNSFGAPLTVFEDWTQWYEPAVQPWTNLQQGMLDVRQRARAFQVEGIPANAVGVDARGIGATALALPRPSPFRGSTLVDYALSKSGAVDIAVFSVTGARVRTLASGGHAAGSGHVTWDGRDERGQNAPAGLYIVRLQAAGTRLQQRLLKLD